MGTYEETIGRTAGVVWGVLNSSKEACSISTLKNQTGLKEREVMLALGWLAREGKVFFDDTDTKLRVQLVNTEYYF